MVQNKFPIFFAQELFAQTKKISKYTNHFPPLK